MSVICVGECERLVVMVVMFLVICSECGVNVLLIRVMLWCDLLGVVGNVLVLVRLVVLYLLVSMLLFNGDYVIMFSFSVLVIGSSLCLMLCWIRLYLICSVISGD